MVNSHQSLQQRRLSISYSDLEPLTSLIYMGGESRSRNQRIQNMLRMIGYGENLGLGFPFILSAWNEKHWLVTEIIEQQDLMQVKLIMHIENKKNVTKDVTKDVTLGRTKEIRERRLRLVELIHKDNHITASEISNIVGVTERTIKRDLAALQKLKIITREGGRNGGKWMIVNVH